MHPDDDAGAPVIRSDEHGSFARSVLAERHPALIQKVRDAFPYEPEQHRALDALLENAMHGVIEPLPPGAHDASQWQDWGREYFGTSWFDAPFLWAESYFYRRLLEAVGYFPPGPWQGVDPFRPFKQAELRTEEADAELAALDRLAPLPAADQAQALLLSSLWGNRADLGFRISAGGEGVADVDSRIVADDSALLWSLLTAGAAATVCLVADNAGRELLPDLVLIDHLLRHRLAERVVLHVKPYPYYVSDATTSDVIDCLRRLRKANGAAASQTGERLWSAMNTGQLIIRAHAFSCAPLPYADMPDDLRADFAGAALTVFKGDLNYRRLVGDRLWPPTTPFAERTAYFPGPVAALRTLKSDVVVGLDAATEEALVARHEQKWRTSGTHALIQVRP
ncbi:damage-control phosphatase ARMT1 family protein [Streptomyces sp. NPDC046939]|uniref:damage-control phosphatase ARMT1 family protein n=1 Tax=Streptomyces sp. NPDC046939 TaxID=3155376 RepID=UPI00340CA594